MGILNYLKFGVNKLFQLACFIIAGYMTVLQFKLYITNEDSSAVSYLRFNKEAMDLYPTYSICFSSYGDPIFKKESFWGDK